jgi:hypothetical protein
MPCQLITVLDVLAPGSHVGYGNNSAAWRAIAGISMKIGQKL